MQGSARKLVRAAAALAAAWAFFSAAAALLPAAETVSREAGAPFGRFFLALPRAARAAWEALAGGARAARENAALRAENERLAAEALGAAALREENAALRRELRLAASDRRLVAAQVLSEGGAAGWSGTLRIDRGTRHGVAPGATVVAPGGLVGRVVSATSRTADVLPVTDPNCRISCVVEGFRDSGHGIVEGGGLSRPGGALSLQHVVEPLHVFFLDNELAITPGALVETAGDGGAFPRGIPVGRVLAAGPEPTRRFQRAKVRPAVDFHALRRVFVMVGTAPEKPAGEGSPEAAGGDAGAGP